MLDSRPDDFDGRNLFFWACLGLLSASRRLDEALAVEIPEGVEEAESTDPGLLAVLGAVAFRRHLEQALSVSPPSASPGTSGTESVAAEGAPGLRELLR